MVLYSRVPSTNSQSKVDANKVIQGYTPHQERICKSNCKGDHFLKTGGSVESKRCLLFLRSCALPLGGIWAPYPHALKLKTVTQAAHTLTCMAIGLSSAMLVWILSLTDLESQTTQLLQAVSFNTSYSHNRGLVRP